jgi:hypothetical protein
MNRNSNIRRLSHAIKEDNNPEVFRQGVVTEVDNPTATCTVKIGNSPTAIAGIKAISLPFPTVGDVVWMVKTGETVFIIGLNNLQDYI